MTPRNQYILALGVSTLVSIGLFAYGAWRNHSLEFSYLLWNLFLAWLPLIFVVRLVSVLRRKLWSSWEAMGLSVLWLVFLPNSFYMISDFIHLQDAVRFNLVYDTVMMTSFIYTGVALGFSSLYLVHLQLRRRFSRRATVFLVSLALFLSSAALYIGRDLRWNSWDILANPGGLLFDVSDRLLHPVSYPNMFVIVISFFILLLSMYGLLWRGAKLMHSASRSETGTRYIAFYGTLRQSGHTPAHPLIREHLVYEGTCLIPGDLYDLGRLPGYEPGDGEVKGELYKLKDMQILPELDAYEAVDNKKPSAPGYSRQLVHLKEPSVRAWVYAYDGPVNGKKTVTSGRWPAK